MNPLVELRGRLSRREIRSKIDELDRLIDNARTEKPQRLLHLATDGDHGRTNRLDEAARRHLALDQQAGMTREALTIKYQISLSSVQRLLRRFEEPS